VKNEPVAAGSGGFFVTIATAAGSTTKKVDGDLLTVGRADDCHLTIAHETLSRRHLTVTLRDGTIWIEDHASSNGTFVNGKRIPAHSLTRILPEDQITMGQAGVRLSLSTEPLMRKEGAPPVPAEKQKQEEPPSDTIVTSTQNVRHKARQAQPPPKAKEKDEAQEQAERTLQEAQKRAAAMIQEAEVEAERRVEDIYRRAHETQAKMDDVYQRRMNEAYRASEQVYQKAQEESQRILDLARQKATEIRLQGENFVMELRRRTEEDCERMLDEAQQTARDLKEQRLIEADDIIQKKEEELIHNAREAMNDRLARFEQDLALEASRQRDELDQELGRRREQLEVDHKSKIDQVNALKEEIAQLREQQTKEQGVLAEIEGKQKKQNERAQALKDEIEAAKKSVQDFNQHISELRADFTSAQKERQTIDRQFKEAQTQLSLMHEEIQASQKRVSVERDRNEAELVQIRAKFEEDKAALAKREQNHFDDMKLQTTRKIQELETRLVDELQTKRDRMTRELALAVEAHLKENRTPNSREMQDLIGTHFQKQIVTIATDETARAKQASLVALKRRQKVVATLQGLIMGALFMFGGERVARQLRNELSPMQRRVAAAQEARKAEMEQRRFNPPQTLDLKPTYVDNVVYTENYVATYTSDEFQKRLLKGLTPYMLKTWRVQEEQVITLLGISSTLVKTLAENKANIHPDFVQKGLDKMKESETEAITRMRTLLGSQVRFESFKKFEKQFYEKYHSTAEAAAAPAAPASQRAPADATPDEQ
jgi:pSer/pThr/pTyr-binding forkhead associated (FHA) protein